jgi:hypothetical protein
LPINEGLEEKMGAYSILFTDESMICAEPYRIKYVRHFAGEELLYCVKKQGFPINSGF